MKKTLMTLCVLAVVACSHKTYTPETCFDMSRCYNVRIVHDVIEMRGISREELADLSACDENTEFYRVKRYGKLNEKFFYGAYDRACLATLYGCRSY